MCHLCLSLSFSPTECLGKMEWNGQKQTNKQSILEAAHRDHEMVIEAFPIFLFFGVGGRGGVQYSEYSDI